MLFLGHRRLSGRNHLALGSRLVERGVNRGWCSNAGGRSSDGIMLQFSLRAGRSVVWLININLKDNMSLADLKDPKISNTYRYGILRRAL